MNLLYLLLCLLAFPAVADQPPAPASAEHIKQQLNSWLWEAARAGDNGAIAQFTTAGYDLNVQDERGYTAVILAAYHGHLETVESLLSAGANACLRDKRGNTALMGAVFKGEVKIARRLIATPCNPDMRNGAGQTAAMYASLFQRQELLAELKAKGADMHATDINGNSVSALAQGKINGQ